MVRLHLGQWLITSQPFARILATVSAVRRQSSALHRSRFLLPMARGMFRKCSGLSSREMVAAADVVFTSTTERWLPAHGRIFKEGATRAPHSRGARRER